jgi:hypothetical protein
MGAWTDFSLPASQNPHDGIVMGDDREIGLRLL